MAWGRSEIKEEEKGIVVGAREEMGKRDGGKEEAVRWKLVCILE